MKHIDHIDPKWVTGRDYQLVCGLDTALNYAERDPSYNVSKSNRFLPWRVTRDEIGVEPVNPGDLCLFLDPDTNEWTLQEFLGQWWWDKTSKTHGPSAAKIGKPRPDLAERNRQQRGKSRKPHSDETKRKMSETAKGRVFSEETRQKMSEAAKRRANSPKGRKQLSRASSQANRTRNNKGQFTKTNND